MRCLSSSISSYSYSGYDALGRVLGGTQTTDGVAYPMSYGYNLAGEMTSQTYPSRRVVTSEYDSAGRLAGVKNQASGLFYAGGAATDSTNRIQYTAHGAVSAMRLGNGLWEQASFNSRLQTTEIDLGTTPAGVDRLKLNYDYGTTANNGNLLSQTITVPTIGSATGFTATQTYTYDLLSRLATAQENGGGSWAQNFSYDRYGNRNFATGTTLPAQLTPANNPVINAGNNRLDITASGQTSVTYDPAGNLTHDVNGHAYVYDGENKQTTYDGGASANGGGTYYYDGDGRRVKKIVGGSPLVSTVFVYNIQGQLVAEYSDAQLTTTGGTSYLTEDTLGTPRVDTDANGNVKARHDYQPFGEELYASVGSRTTQNGYVGDNINQKFTLKERDNETGLDYFGARYYSSAQGRFTKPDPLLSSGDVDSPQSWNRYSYVLNHPLELTDPFGLYVFDPHVAEPDREKFRKALSRARSDLWKIAATYGVKSNEFKEAQRALNVYGGEGVKNGVAIYATTDTNADPAGTQVAGVPGRKTAENPNGQDIRITIRSDEFSNPMLDGLIGHEGSHAADGSAWVQSGFSNGPNPTIYQTEFSAFTVQSLLGQSDYPHQYAGAHLSPFKAPGMAEIPGMNIKIWNSAWAEPDRAKLRAENIDVILRAPKGAGGYDVAPASQGGPAFRRGARFK